MCAVLQIKERCQAKKPTRSATWADKWIENIRWFGEVHIIYSIDQTCCNSSLIPYLEPCMSWADICRHSWHTQTLICIYTVLFMLMLMLALYMFQDQPALCMLSFVVWCNERSVYRHCEENCVDILWFCYFPVPCYKRKQVHVHNVIIM